MLETAEQFIATTEASYDAILVDLYGPAGPAEIGEPFWRRCLDLLAPGGCLACNWADFSVNPAVRPMTEALSAVARSRGLAPTFVTRRGFRDNLVQYVATAPESWLRGDGEAFAGLVDRFAAGAPPARPRPRHSRQLHRDEPLSDRLSRRGRRRSGVGRGLAARRGGAPECR